MLKIAVFASGKLGYDLVKYIHANYSISVVFSDKKSNDVIEFATSNRIPLFSGNPRNGRALNFIKKYEVDILLSINYVFLLERDVIDWPKLGAVNFHGSLLPKYRGRTPHVWAIINNEKECGVTAHFIDEDCDNGDIIQQVIISIDNNDTGASLLNKYHLVYPNLIDETIYRFIENKIVREAQDHTKATYFGKRSPEDGLINWDWQKERIRNFVRALAHPYPGAFTYYDNKKIVIDEIQYEDSGYDYSLANGTILSSNPLVVKTPNGAISVSKFREMSEKIEPGGKFSSLQSMSLSII